MAMAINKICHKCGGVVLYSTIQQELDSQGLCPRCQSEVGYMVKDSIKNQKLWSDRRKQKSKSQKVYREK